MWNKDEVAGKSRSGQGPRQGVGRRDEQRRSSFAKKAMTDQAAGNVEEAFGKGRRKVGEAIKDLGNKIGQ